MDQAQHRRTDLDQNETLAQENRVENGNRSFHVVGIGASAGGLEALEIFFKNMRPDSGLAFVVIQHLSPDFKSLMDELLSRHTQIAIHRVEDGMQVGPNAIYLIPPKKEMIISDGRLLLTDKDPNQAVSLPIDNFFRSLAQDCGDRSVGIVLSGTGSDGSRGIRAIHDARGLVIAQSAETAKFDGMPRTAFETGVVDVVLPPQAMPNVLLEHVNHPTRREEVGQEKQDIALEQGLNQIYSLLRDEYGIDFSHYKPSTVNRRIARRLQLNHSMDLVEYIDQLMVNSDELNALFKDLLIGVTKFFRDPGAYDRLANETLPALLAKTPHDVPLRIWIAGSATGEEAYSIGILVHEALSAHNRPTEFKIFATDVHRASLDVASAGIYSEEAVSEVSDSRLSRYFNKQGQHYQIVPELRKMIVFAPHNVIKDAPFTKLDLVCCRNLLIYFQPHVQKKVLSLFHFALKPGGILFLGPSESPGEISDEFDTVDRHWKIYRKRRDVRLPPDMRLPLSSGFSRLHDPLARPASQTRALPDASLLRAYDAMLDQYVPPSLLVNEQRTLIHSFAGAGKYLRFPDGRSSRDVLDLVVPDARLAISGALQRAAKSGEPATFGGIVVGKDDDQEHLKLTVRPLSNQGKDEKFFLISLESKPPVEVVAPTEAEIDAREASKQRLVEVEEELQYTKENLQATIEEMETTNEELQATNEELVASNEELQSTNEELHSVNEELYTVNAEYQRKIGELTELTDDIDNLLRSTEVGTIFLDRDLRIRKFTPKIAQAFQLLPQDVGRSLETFSHGLQDDDLLVDVRRVLDESQPLERDVQDRQGNWYLLRILPYRSKTDVDGVVVTLIDIANLKRTEQKLRRMSKVFMDGADPIIIEDLSGTIVDVNSEAERVYKWNRNELIGQNIDILVPDGMQQQARKLRNRCKNAEHVRNTESVRTDRDGNIHPILLTLSLLSDETGKPIGVATISKDIARQKAAEQAALEAAERRDQFLAMLSHELRNPLSAVMNGIRVLDHDDADRATRRNACEVVKRQSNQMARLLDDLLDVSRVTHGKIQIRNDVVDLTELVQAAVEAVRPVIDARSHRLILEIKKHPILVAGDATRLLQIQENLLTNAAKYTPQHGEIQLTLDTSDNQATIRVQDDGDGIAPEMRKKIFDLFVQADKALERSDGGMGVGLTLTRRLVELHGGTITANSAGRGKGSEFVVTLPLTNKQPAATVATQSLPEAGGRVLIVEDNPDSREMLETLLRLDGYEVSTARDGIEGWEAIRANPPNVALIDIGLPRLDGYQLARRVRAESSHHHVRLVALTGYGRADDRRAVREAGFDEHLVKPVQPSELNRVLRNTK